MDKVKALQGFMKKEKLSALLIPHADEFQGEYISPASERLKWLTGFTGSAGFAVITPDKAAFFTDGRYVLQAQKEVPSFYEQHNISQKTPYQWVAENLSPSDPVGYDPWLFTERQLQAYEHSLVPLKENPIDPLWKDRPAPGRDFIRIHPLSYAGESDESKRKRIGAALKEDHVLITACDSIAWLLNIRGNDIPHTPIVHSICLLHKDGTYDLFVDLVKVNAEIFNHLSKGEGRAIDIRQLLFHLTKIEGTCQLDPQTTPTAIIQTLEKAGVKIGRHPDPCLLPKAIKNETELKGAQDAHIQDGMALCRFMAWLEEQPLTGETTEISAAEKLREFRKDGKDFKQLSFGTISAFGPHGAIIHYQPTPASDLPLKREGLFLVDSGGQYLTGTTDVTRTLALGPSTSEQKRAYTQVLKGHITLAQATFPKGTSGRQLDTLARQFLWQDGWDYDHGTGHGVGSYLCVHEGPQGISKRASDISLEPGMILSNEPGYYKEGAFGIRIESLIQVVQSQQHKDFYNFETLTLVPFDPKLIDTNLLNEAEMKWIEAYNKKICSLLSPHLDPSTKAWLLKTCAVRAV